MAAGAILYTRQGCHLCEAFIAELVQYDAAFAAAVVLVDVDASAADRQAHGDKVPLLFIDDIEVCRYYFDAERLKSCFKLQGDSLE